MALTTAPGLFEAAVAGGIAQPSVAGIGVKTDRPGRPSGSARPSQCAPGGSVRGVPPGPACDAGAGNCKSVS